MAFYLVTAKPKKELLSELEEKLVSKEFVPIKPFGYEVNKCLGRSRWEDETTMIWEENDFCIPPLKEEKAAILDKYFDDISVEKVEKNKGWEQIKDLQFVFPDLEKIFDD